MIGMQGHETARREAGFRNLLFYSCTRVDTGVSGLGERYKNKKTLGSATADVESPEAVGDMTQVTHTADGDAKLVFAGRIASFIQLSEKRNVAHFLGMKLIIIILLCLRHNTTEVNLVLHSGNRDFGVRGVFLEILICVLGKRFSTALSNHVNSGKLGHFLFVKRDACR